MIQCLHKIPIRILHQYALLRLNMSVLSKSSESVINVFIEHKYTETEKVELKYLSSLCLTRKQDIKAFFS